MKALKPLFFLILIAIPLTGCGTVLYLSKLGWHQTYITFHSVPVQEILKDEGMNTEVKEKIHFIQEVKRYGEEALDLKKTKGYSTYFDTNGPILYVVTASEKDRFQLREWNFPITGKVTYKGFFKREEALKEQHFLNQKELDTFVQSAGAYSTLGWLKDPIFSSMMKWDEAPLANLILHEMAHATVYFKGQTDFNEQLATFIGNQGSLNFLTDKFGLGSKEVVEATHLQEDDLFFSNWIDQAYQRLSNLYGREISKDEKLRRREEIFESLKEEFRKVKSGFKTDNYQDIDRVAFNNAVLMAYRRYIHHLNKLEILHEHLGRDIRRVIGFFKEIRRSGGEPFSILEKKLSEFSSVQ